MSKVWGVTVGTNYDKSKLPSGGLTDDQSALLTSLKDWYDKENYEWMTASLSPPTSIFEVNAKKSVTFSWSFSEEVSSVTFNGEAQPTTQTGSVTIKDITSSKPGTTFSYTVSGTRKDGNKETKNATASVSFHNKYYFGCAAKPTTIDSAFIKKLTMESDWARSRKTFSKTVKCAEGEYIWYAYPSRLGTSMFKMGGFQGGFAPVHVVTFKNDSEYEESYYVYQSSKSGLGDIIIDVL